MVWKHDTTGADANAFCSCCDMTNHNRGCGARDARHVVMLRHPNAAVAPGLGVNCDITRVVERAPRVGILGDADQIEDGQCCHNVPNDTLR